MTIVAIIVDQYQATRVARGYLPLACESLEEFEAYITESMHSYNFQLVVEDVKYLCDYFNVPLSEEFIQLLNEYCTSTS